MSDTKLTMSSVAVLVIRSCIAMSLCSSPNSSSVKRTLYKKQKYAYVFRISLKDNPHKITFANHNRYNGGQPGRMHVQDFFVEALKEESGFYVRYVLGEALAVGWSDSYPSGYGFYEKNAPHAPGFYKGPFFPSVHSGSGRSPCSGCTPTDFEPGVVGGSPHYNHKGWYTANSVDKTGQTSIWFK